MQNVSQLQVQSNSCMGNVHAKILEIILLLGFSSTSILLVVNLILTTWFFKFSYSLFIIEIGLVVLNSISIFLSIILRVFRSNDSVFNKNFSSSNIIAMTILILIILNILSSITEEVLFSFVFTFLNKCGYFSDEMANLANEFNLDDYDWGDDSDDDFDNIWNNKLDDDWEDDLDDDYDDINENIFKNFEKIMNKNYEEIFDDPKNFKKFKMLRVLPWITINYNILIQGLSIMFIILLIKRIKFKSNFGSQQVIPNSSGLPITFQNPNDKKNNAIFQNNDANNVNDKHTKKSKMKKSIASNASNNILEAKNSDKLEINGKKRHKHRKSSKKSKS